MLSDQNRNQDGVFESGYAKHPGRMLIVVLLICGCASSRQDELDAHLKLTLDPSPPIVGPANVSLSMTGPGGSPVAGAKVSLEGNMNHAGMKPSFADLTEGEPGQYAGTLEFTMGGDWFVIVTATTPDGRRLERKIDVRGVKAQ